GILSPLAIEIVSDWLLGHGYEVDPESTDFKQFALKFIKAQSAATKQLKQRQLGEHMETPEAPQQVGPRGSSSRLTLTDVFDKWKLERKPSRSTLDEWTLCIRLFEELNGKLSLAEITKAHIV